MITEGLAHRMTSDSHVHAASSGDLRHVPERRLPGNGAHVLPAIGPAVRIPAALLPLFSAPEQPGAVRHSGATFPDGLAHVPGYRDRNRPDSS